mmetsp:Transcript_6921/g.16488  ORF Transcript_6921/g.16488 Transcript_6921/m.16488 type:complete len:253 (+) Transcript_6921:104-862(+)
MGGLCLLEGDEARGQLLAQYTQEHVILLQTRQTFVQSLREFISTAIAWSHPGPQRELPRHSIQPTRQYGRQFQIDVGRGVAQLELDVARFVAPGLHAHPQRTLLVLHGPPDPVAGPASRPDAAEGVGAGQRQGQERGQVVQYALQEGRASMAHLSQHRRPPEGVVAILQSRARAEVAEGHVNVQAVAGLVGEDLGEEQRPQAVLPGHGRYGGAGQHDVVGQEHGIVLLAEDDLDLARGGLGVDLLDVDGLLG